MTKLIWDKVGQRLFEVGVDRGVLYKTDNFGVAWNGLTNVDEQFSDDTSEPVYFDGVKVNENPSIGDFAANLSALTYPDEFLDYEGVLEVGQGLYVDGQAPKPFGLSYRTLVGNDAESTDFGYKVHICYNLTAVTSDMTRETLNEAPNPMAFTWSITSVPVPIPGHRATAHVIFDSRFIPADILAAVEDILYGTNISGAAIYDGGPPEDVPRSEIDGGTPSIEGPELPDFAFVIDTEPRLPSIDELINLVTLWGPKLIVPHTDTGLAELVDGVGDLTQINVPGIFTVLPTTRLAESDQVGFFQLV